MDGMALQRETNTYEEEDDEKRGKLSTSAAGGKGNDSQRLPGMAFPQMALLPPPVPSTDDAHPFVSEWRRRKALPEGGGKGRDPSNFLTRPSRMAKH
ncbi:hypothetical protein niasHT_037549 [Heterodera trifolii]|uniref:Uncharacterized protein n=1 Tax=Heterodera trifolii TaxID=157864 RepID=A0ABD2IP69_9BILA